MNIFVLYFFTAFLAFHSFAFSQAKSEKTPDQEQTGALLDLCLSEITTRRIVLKEEMKELSTKMNEGEEASADLSAHDKYIYQTLIKALILNTITAKPLIIDLSETTCDILLDDIISDPETKSTAVNMLFSQFEKHTDAFIKLELMKFLSKETPSVPAEKIPKSLLIPTSLLIPEEEHTPPVEEDTVPPEYIKI